MKNEKAMLPPVDPTRRRFLSQAASVAAGSAVLAMASPPASAADDPIFAAIDAFRRAHALFFAEHVGDIPDEIGDQYSAACSVMQRTRPTTPAGLAVLTTWAREQADWLCANSSYLPGKDLCALTVSIDDATRGMSGLEPWSPPLPAAVAPASPLDPVFALIADHTKSVGTVDLIEAEHSWLFEHNMPISDDELTEPASAELGLFLELLEVVPTTLAGVVALVTYLDQIRQKDPWKFEDNYATPLIGTLAKAFSHIAVQS